MLKTPMNERMKKILSILGINVAFMKKYLVIIHVLWPIATVPWQPNLQPRFHVTIVVYYSSSVNISGIYMRVVA